MMSCRTLDANCGGVGGGGGGGCSFTGNSLSGKATEGCCMYCEFAVVDIGVDAKERSD